MSNKKTIAVRDCKDINCHDCEFYSFCMYGETHAWRKRKGWVAAKFVNDGLHSLERLETVEND